MSRSLVKIAGAAHLTRLQTQEREERERAERLAREAEAQRAGLQRLAIEHLSKAWDVPQEVLAPPDGLAYLTHRDGERQRWLYLRVQGTVLGVCMIWSPPHIERTVVYLAYLSTDQRADRAEDGTYWKVDEAMPIESLADLGQFLLEGVRSGH